MQAKCYSPDYDITKHDIDKFLSESNRPSIKHRLLIATTDRIGAHAKQVCDAQEKPVIRFLFSDFDKSALDYPADFASLPQAKRKARPTPRDHQVDACAVQSFRGAMEGRNRGQIRITASSSLNYLAPIDPCQHTGHGFAGQRVLEWLSQCCGVSRNFYDQINPQVLRCTLRSISFELHLSPETRI